MASALSAPVALGQTIRGVVLDDSTSRPTAEVLVTLLDADGVELRPGVRSDQAGRFAIPYGHPGTFRLRATRIGYQPLTTGVVRVAIGEVVSLELRMSPAAQSLVPARVVERRQLSLRELMTTDGYELRKSRGIGTFTGPEELERLRQEYGPKTDLYIVASTGTGGMRPVEGFSLGGIQAVGGGRYAHCSPEVYLDGMRMSQSGGAPRAFGMMSGIPVSWIYGIEVYRKHEIPPQGLGGPFGSEPPRPPKRFTSFPDTCGIIAVWTKFRAQRPAEGELDRAMVVRGTVLDDETRRPIADVVVNLISAQWGRAGMAGVTDSLGRFMVASLLPATFRLEASRDGYRSVRTPDFPGDTAEVTVVQLLMSTRRVPNAPLSIIGRRRTGSDTTLHRSRD